MNATLIQPKTSEYPAALHRAFGRQALPPLAAIGNRDVLRCRPLGLFCFIKCTGDVILRTYDLTRTIRDAGILAIGGFHSPMEKECLTLLLRGVLPNRDCPSLLKGTVRFFGEAQIPPPGQRIISQAGVFDPLEILLSPPDLL